MHKRILMAAFAVFAFASCDETNDCECKFLGPAYNVIQEYTIEVKDWDGNCEKIDYHDIHLDKYVTDLECLEI
ncbi:MAG: hypothetical protein LBR17_09810 [Bacteroidales bacterium]|jgi:hypothetical protein|nr:hypothetical protein [Bacteroidales bacterium]